MASNYTEHLNLCQWAAEDPVLREDFNADNQKLEAVLSQMPRIAVGSYTGKGTYGNDNQNTLTFDFQPKLVVISKNELETSGAGTTFIYGQTQNAGASYIYQNNTSLSIHITWGDKTVSWYSDSTADRQLNSADATYFYYAIG